MVVDGLGVESCKAYYGWWLETSQAGLSTEDTQEFSHLGWY